MCVCATAYMLPDWLIMAIIGYYFISLYLMKTENVGWSTGLQVDGKENEKRELNRKKLPIEKPLAKRYLNTE